MSTPTIDDYHKETRQLDVLQKLHNGPNKQTFNHLRLVIEMAHDIGAYKEALMWSQDYLEMGQQLFGPNNHQVGTAYSKLGKMMIQHGRYQLANKYLDHALNIYNLVLGESAVNEDIGNLYNLYGKLFCDQCLFTEAIRCHEQALSIFCTMNTTERTEFNIAMTYRHIGDVFYTSGRLKDALSQYKKSTELFQIQLLQLIEPQKEFLLDFCRTHYRLAKAKSACGLWQKALYFCNDGYLMLKRYLPGKEAIEFAEYGDCLCAINTDSGNYTDAIKAANWALTIRKRFYNVEGVATYQPMAVNLIETGRIHYKMYKHHDAIVCFDNALDILQSVYGSHHPEIGRLYNYYVDAYIYRSDFSKALSYCSKALAVQRVCYGVACDHVDLITTHCQFGEIYVHLEDYDSAHKSNFTSLEMCKRLFSDHFDTELTSRNYINFGLTYLGQGENRQALLYFEKALETLRHVYGSLTAHKNINNAYNMIGLAYRNLQRTKESRKYHLRAFANCNAFYMGAPRIETAKCHLHLGDLAYMSGDYSSSMSSYMTAATLCRDFEAKNNYRALEYAQILTAIGRIHYIYFDLFKAKMYLEKAQEVMGTLYGEQRVHPWISIVRLYFGDLYKVKGNYKLSLMSYERSLEAKESIYKENIERHDIAELCYNIGHALAYFHKYHDSFKYYRRAFAIWSKLYKGVEHLALAQGLQGMGSAYANLNRYDTALTFCEKSLAMKRNIFKSDLNQKDVVLCHLLIGDVKRQCKLYKTALHAQYRGLSIAQAMKDRPRWYTALCLDDVARTLIAQGEYHQAADKLKESLNLKTRCTTGGGSTGGVSWGLRQEAASPTRFQFIPSIAKTVFYLGQLHHADGMSIYHIGPNEVKRRPKFDLALEHYQMALELYEKVYDENCVVEIADLYNNMGEVMNQPQVAQYDEAMISHKKALTLRKELFSDFNGNHLDIAKSYLNLGITYTIQELYDEANANLDTSLQKVKSHYGAKEDALEIAEVYEAQGNVHFRQGNHPKALECYLACLKIRQAHHNIAAGRHTPQLVRVHKHLVDTYEKMGKKKEADRSRKEVIKATDSTTASRT